MYQNEMGIDDKKQKISIVFLKFFYNLLGC